MPSTINNLHDAANRNVLLIEDEGEMCLLLNLILDPAGLIVEHVKSLAAADAFLSKPFTKAKLLASVNSLIS